MEKIKTKKIKIYPYFINNLNINKISTWETIFDKKNIIKNVIKYGENALCLVCDNKKEDDEKLLKLRFLKLKSEVPKIINKQTGIEKPININTILENIIYSTHLIIDLENKLIFSEYSHNAARHINTNLPYYLNKIFDVEDENIEIHTLRNLETYSEMIKDTSFKILKTKTKSINLSKKEELKPCSFLGNIFNYGGDDNFEIEISIKKSRSSKGLNKTEIESFVKEYKDKYNDEHKRFLETLKIETENSSYDLLNNNLTYYYSDPIDLEKGSPITFQIYNELVRLYNLKKEILLKNFNN